jgi:methylase of polypeptide subunit release factors
MVETRPTIHEADFCGQIASAVNILVQQDSKFSPIHEARVEGFGTGAGRRKRKDLRFFDNQGKLILCGEVKLPGTPEGRSPYDAKLCEDARQKAENARVRFFFTWNVNTFVLWDLRLWEGPLLEKRVSEWRLDRNLRDPEEVAREDNLRYIKSHFLPLLIADVADIISERRKDWSLPPDDIFIRSLESHLDWPVQLLSAYILEQSDQSKAFGSRVEQWMVEQDWIFVRSPREEWIKAVDNMAKTLAYVWTNRLIFYKALLARFSGLPRLELRSSVKNPEEAVAFFNRLFQLAVERSGDYEPLLMPDAKDWATTLVFCPPGALDGWRGLLRGIGSIDFSEVTSDVVGRIFQKLIGPEERHRYGQHFTGDDVVDLINAFSVHKANDTVFDPACGSGSFLVRAYYLKRGFDPTRAHLDLISELFGCDIAMYPAHLATLNLAAREISDEANYPRICRRDFFDFVPGKPFCFIPDDASAQRAVALPPLDAIVGNPPYVRQEKIEKEHKTQYGQLVTGSWPDLTLSGRSDLHCYFWPVATRLLKQDGYFGFLTSSSWLDVEYGFSLQGWMLRHFRILAIMESATEPWFEDARVKTCVTILQRCEDESKRMKNQVRFVRFNRKLADIIGIPPGQDEGARQASVERLRKDILETEADYHDQNLRIIIKSQKDLWDAGVKAASILAGGGELESSGDTEEEQFPNRERKQSSNVSGPRKTFEFSGSYRAGKWGRYLRAPDFYFEIMRRFGDKLVPLGDITEIRRGITNVNAIIIDTLSLRATLGSEAISICSGEIASSFRSSQ